MGGNHEQRQQDSVKELTWLSLNDNVGGAREQSGLKNSLFD